MRQCQSPFCGIEFEPNTHNQRYHSGQCKRDVENIARRRVGTSTAMLAQEAAMVQGSVDEELEVGIDEQLEYLRAINRTLAKENAKLKVSRYELVHAVSDAIHEKLQDLRLPPVPQPTPDRRRKTEEVACAVLSDFQIGKKTLDYNVAVSEQRVQEYGDKLLRITEVQRADHPVRQLRVWLLGDMVEGETVFPGQSHTLDKGLYYQVAVDGPRIIVGFLRRMLAHFESIHVVGVVGNHGVVRGPSHGEMHPETNADRMLYGVIRLILEHEDRITWDIPSGELEGDFFTIDKIGKKSFFLFHGHQIKGMGLPVAGIDRKIKGWSMGAVKEKFDYALMGHFHTPTRLTVNTTTVWINGTIESSNGYAVEVLAAIGRPCQYLLFTHPEHGVTSEWCVYLDNNW